MRYFLAAVLALLTDHCSAASRPHLIRNRNVLVTGASRGLGISIAGAFAAEGAASVCLVARSGVNLEAARDKLRAEHPNVAFHPIVADVSSPDDRVRIVDAAQALGGFVSVVVNNAGIEDWGPFEECTAASIDAQLQVNLLAPMHLSRALLPPMLERREGAIVNVVSIAGKLGSPNSAAYTASKHGLVGFTRALRSEYDARGISSCAVCPSFVSTPLLDSLVAKAGGARPPFFTSTTVDAVSRACVRGVIEDADEIIVNSVPLRPALCLYEAFPSLPRLVERSLPWLYGFNRRCGGAGGSDDSDNRSGGGGGGGDSGSGGGGRDGSGGGRGGSGGGRGGSGGGGRGGSGGGSAGARMRASTGRSGCVRAACSCALTVAPSSPRAAGCSRQPARATGSASLLVACGCLFAIIVTAAAAAPAVADGFDDAVVFCPDDRVVCVSSYDDKPGHFVEPWEYDGSKSNAVAAVSEVATQLGGFVTRDDTSARGTALRVSFASSADVAIFWLPNDDALVQFRSERVDGSLWDGAANKRRIDLMRKRLGYAPAPMVRNRQYRPGEIRADGSIKLEEERPYRRADGRFYGNQGGGEGDATSLTSVSSPEGLARLLNPFGGKLGGRSQPAQAVYDDLKEMTTMRVSVEEKLYNYK